jgi:hypothetical protein
VFKGRNLPAEGLLVRGIEIPGVALDLHPFIGIRTAHIKGGYGPFVLSVLQFANVGANGIDPVG